MITNYANWTRINKLAVKQVGRFAVYVSNGLDPVEHEDNLIWDWLVSEVKVRYVQEGSEMLGHLVNGGLFFFDSKEEMETFYSLFEAPLTDSSGIYACTYDCNGECLTENT